MFTVSEHISHKKGKDKRVQLIGCSMSPQWFDRFHCSTSTSTDAEWKWRHAAVATVAADRTRVQEWGESGFTQAGFILDCLCRSEGTTTSHTIFSQCSLRIKSWVTSTAEQRVQVPEKRHIQFTLICLKDIVRVDCAARFGVVILLLKLTTESGCLFSQSIFFLLWWPMIEATAQQQRQTKQEVTGNLCDKQVSCMHACLRTVNSHVASWLSIWNGVQRLNKWMNVWSI